MQTYFSIGETAKINGISVKALRHYDEMDLLKPAYIDQETHYRYYTYDQFPYIDKIKRYKDVGLSLRDIKAFFDTKSNQTIEDLLQKQSDRIRIERTRLAQMEHNAELLLSFFEDSRNTKCDGVVYQKHEEERTIICPQGLPDHDIMEMDMYLRLSITENKLDSLPLLNPYGYILAIKEFWNGNIKFTHPYVTTTFKGTSHLIRQLPEGEYVCFRAPILADDADITPLTAYLNQHHLQPKLIIANEYLKSFYDPTHSPYEIQALV